MSSAPRRLVFGDLSVEGWSRAGQATWFRVRPGGLAFDAGAGGEPALAGVERIFVSHGHLDHALGVPYQLSYRALAGEGATTIYCPREIADRLADVIRACERLEGGSYAFELQGLEPGDRVRIGRDLLVEAFRSRHTVPSLGYLLLRESARLLPALSGLDGAEIAARRMRGETVETRQESDWLGYGGDLSIETLDENQRLYEVPVLLLECTFLGDDPVERASRFGHVHFAQIVERREQFANERIVLHHLSRRHTADALRAAIDSELGPLADRIEVIAP